MGSRIRRAKTAARQIRAIVIQARSTGMVLNIEDPVQAFRRVTGGQLEHVDAAEAPIGFWCNRNAEKMDVNRLATALWYCLDPKAAAQRWRDGDVLRGPVIITGGLTPRGESKPVPAWAVSLWHDYRNTGVKW